MPARSRNWAFVSYREDIVDVMSNSLLPCAVSPLHDSDCWSHDDVVDWVKRHPKSPVSEQPIEGEVKKAHRHVLVCFKDAKNMTQAFKCIQDVVPDVHYVVRVRDKDAYVRYLCHLDSTDKHHYDVEDVHSFYGMKCQALYGDYSDRQSRAFITVIDEINDGHLYAYKDLVNWARDTGDPDVLLTVIQNGASWATVMRDRRYEREGARKVLIESTDDIDEAADKLIQSFMA